MDKDINKSVIVNHMFNLEYHFVSQSLKCSITRIPNKPKVKRLYITSLLSLWSVITINTTHSPLQMSVMPLTQLPSEKNIENDLFIVYFFCL